MLDKPNKRWSAMNIGRVGVPPLPVNSTATNKISPADRRMLCGVYWGTLDTGLTIGNSKNFDQAQKLYNDEDRLYQNVLPRNLLWTITDGFSDTDGKRKVVLDTGFYAVPCASVTDLESFIVFPSQKLGQYVAANSNLPITIRSINNVIIKFSAAPPAAVYDPVNCWDSNGNFIGNGTPNACASYLDLSPTRYRFRDTGGNPLGSTYKDLVGNTYFRIPIFPTGGKDESGQPIGPTGQTLSLWEDCEDRVYNTHPQFGKAIVDALLTTYGVTVSTHDGGAGIILDYEDFLRDAQDTNPLNNPTTKALYDNDPRFATASPTTEVVRLYQQYVGTMLDRRAQRIFVQAGWTQELLSCLYDSDWIYAGNMSTLFSTAYGTRKRISLRCYAWSANGGTNDIVAELFNLGNQVFRANFKLPASAQLADFWFSAGSQTTNPLAPINGEALTIVQSVMNIRCAMALGALRSIFYRDTERPAHPYFSALVAYDGMQGFAEIIKNGTNYIPPATINRFQSNAYEVTAFYRKDKDLADINADTWITCRIYNEQMLFFGGTTGGATREYTVKAPTGDNVKVLATPYGDVTVVSPPATGLKKIPLLHFVDRSDRLKPKGLMTAAGLTSAMRNPMVEGPYRDYLLLDFRPRDNWNISGNRENVRQAELRLIEDNDDFGAMAVDEEGIYVEEKDPLPTNPGPTSSLQVNDEPGGSLFSLDKDTLDRDKIAVALAAIKVKSLTLSYPTDVTKLQGSQLGYYAPTGARLNAQLMRSDVINSENKFRAVLYSLANQDAFHAYPSGTTGEIIGGPTGSVEKWILVQLVKEANNRAVMRALGGQYGTGTPQELIKDALLGQPVPPWGTNNFRVPIRKQCRLGFATLAHYVNETGVPTTGADQIIWDVFDGEHICKEYAISGNRIVFTCITNQVSWQIKKLDGNWYKQSDVTGLWVLLSSGDARRFYTNGATLDTDQFTAIQPVLKNTGDLKSDTLAVLTSASAGFP